MDFVLLTFYRPPRPDLGDRAHAYTTDDSGRPLTDAKQLQSIGALITDGSDPPQGFRVVEAESLPQIA